MRRNKHASVRTGRNGRSHCPDQGNVRLAEGGAPRGVYRRYPLEVGNGFSWEGGHSFLSFPPERTGRLAAPFPFEREWVWEAEAGEPDEAKMRPVLDGNLELIDIGCGQTFCLIVTGPCRGEIWHFTDVGIQPCCRRQDFLGWLEKWLDEGDDADCFAEYSYIVNAVEKE